MLNQLPVELIQLVLQDCSTPSFIHAAFTCRTLLEIASDCREVLLVHLSRTPGVRTRKHFDKLKTKELFRILLKRSYKQLYGAQFTATCQMFDLGGKGIQLQASCVDRAARKMILVDRDQKSVYIANIGRKEICLESQLSPAWDEPGEVEVLKTAFDRGGDVYVLQRFTPAVDETDAKFAHPFVKQAMQSGPRHMVYLVCYKKESAHRPVRVISVRNHEQHEPRALAVLDSDRFMISWWHILDEEPEVAIYSNSKTLFGNSPDSPTYWEEQHPRILPVADERPDLVRQRPVTDLDFTGEGRRVFFQYGGQTLPDLFQSYAPHESATNYRTVRFSQTLTLLFRHTGPFLGAHEDRGTYCERRYLALGVATHRGEGWTVACVLRAAMAVMNCNHVLDLERGQELDHWDIVARLWGYREPTNTLGSIVAVSNSGTRIAVANWNILYVWALEPDALINDNRNGFYPPNMQSPRTGIVELRPIALRLDAVCFKLRFHTNSKLVAITDRGVMYWDLNRLGRGERSTHSLTLAGRDVEPCK